MDNNQEIGIINEVGDLGLGFVITEEKIKQDKEEE